MKGEHAPILLGLLIFLLHVPVAVALGVVVLSVLVGEHGRSPRRHRA